MLSDDDMPADDDLPAGDNIPTDDEDDHDPDLEGARPNADAKQRCLDWISVILAHLDGFRVVQESFIKKKYLQLFDSISIRILTVPPPDRRLIPWESPLQA